MVDDFIAGELESAFGATDSDPKTVIAIPADSSKQDRIYDYQDQDTYEIPRENIAWDNSEYFVIARGGTPEEPLNSTERYRLVETDRRINLDGYTITNQGDNPYLYENEAMQEVQQLGSLNGVDQADIVDDILMVSDANEQRVFDLTDLSEVSGSPYQVSTEIDNDVVFTGDYIVSIESPTESNEYPKIWGIEYPSGDQLSWSPIDMSDRVDDLADGDTLGADQMIGANNEAVIAIASLASGSSFTNPLAIDISSGDTLGQGAQFRDEPRSATASSLGYLFTGGSGVGVYMYSYSISNGSLSQEDSFDPGGEMRALHARGKYLAVMAGSDLLVYDIEGGSADQIASRSNVANSDYFDQDRLNVAEGPRNIVAFNSNDGGAGFYDIDNDEMLEYSPTGPEDGIPSLGGLAMAMTTKDI